MSQLVPILLCDDDPLLLELLAYRLQGKGYAVETASDGGEAWSKLSQSHPAAVVLDVMMPTMNGLELLRKIREDGRLSQIPVVVLTARKQEKDVLAALELGASDFLSKPFMPEELAARLQRLVRAGDL